MSKHLKGIELNGDNPYVVEHIYIRGSTNDIRIGHGGEATEDEVWLSVEQFLMLLDWGAENRPALEQLAKEQGGEQ